MSTTTLPGRMARLGNAIGATRACREADARARWPREEIEAYQRARLGELVSAATQRSAFFRERYGGVLDPDEVELAALPPVTKQEWMARFDDVVTDPALRLHEVEAHLETIEDDVLYLGKYRVMASSGATGGRGVYVWSVTDWRTMSQYLMRDSRARGDKPALPRLRFANVMAPDPRHTSQRFMRSNDGGVLRLLNLSAATPVAELTAALERFRPDKLGGYPSILARLATEQLAGRLHIEPRWVMSSGEVLTEEMSARIVEAWGVAPTNVYAMTETGPVGSSCPEAGNLHLYEDSCIIEPVDATGQPVARGEHGAGILVTSLINRTQPVIRLRVSDELTIATDPCPCGRTQVHLEALRGRNDDILEFRTPAGEKVEVHPVQLRAPFASMPEVVSYQFVHTPTELDIQVVLGRRDEGLPDRLQRTFEDVLRSRGVTEHAVRVRAVDHIPRESGAAKFKLVRKVPGPVPA